MGNKLPWLHENIEICSNINCRGRQEIAMVCTPKNAMLHRENCRDHKIKFAMVTKNNNFDNMQKERKFAIVIKTCIDGKNKGPR